MTEPIAEFGLHEVIFIPFLGVPHDQPDRIDREERLVKTIQNLEDDQGAVRENVIYITSLKKDGILQENLTSPKKDTRINAVEEEAMLASLSTPAEVGKTLVDYDSRPDDFPPAEMPEVDPDVEMSDDRESIDQLVQRMVQEASAELKKSIIDEYNNNTSPRIREIHLQEEHDPIKALFLKQVMERRRNETEEMAAQKAMNELKLTEWSSPGRRLERLVEATIRELEGHSQRSKVAFYREALERERVKNGGAAVRMVEKPLAAAAPPPPPPLPTNTHRVPTPKLIMAAPPVDHSRAYNGNGLAPNQFHSHVGTPGGRFWTHNAEQAFLAENPPIAAPMSENIAIDRKSVEVNEEEKWLLHLKEYLRLPWKDIAKKWTEKFTKSKNEAALQMQYKRLRDRLHGGTSIGNTPVSVPMNNATYGPVFGVQQSGQPMTNVHQPGQPISNTQQPEPSITHMQSSGQPIPHIQQSEQSMLKMQPLTQQVSNAPQWINTATSTSVAQPPTQPSSNIPRWTAINQQQSFPLPSQSVPSPRVDQPVSISYLYQPPPIESLAPDHPNMKNLEIFHRNAPISNGTVALDFIVMKTVPFTDRATLAVREGEKIHVVRYISGNTFVGNNSRGFQAKVSDEVLWSDNRIVGRNQAVEPSAAGSPAYEAQPSITDGEINQLVHPWSTCYRPPLIPQDHCNVQIFKMLTDSPIKPGDLVNFSFTAMKGVPHTGNSRVLALRLGERITMVKYLSNHEFMAKNYKEHTALITDDVLWGERHGEENPKVPNSSLEKLSQLLIRSNTSVPTGPENKALDSSASNMDVRQKSAMISSEQENTQQPPYLNHNRKDTVAQQTPQNSTYNLPRRLHARHPNLALYDFIKHKPPLRRGTKIKTRFVAMKDIVLRKEHYLKNVKQGDVVQIIEYVGDRTFLCKNGKISGVVEDDAFWAEPDEQSRRSIVESDAAIQHSVQEHLPSVESTRRVENANVYRRNAALLSTGSWAAGRVVNLDVLAVQHVSPGEGRLEIEMGDLVSVSKCISQSRFIGRNMRTGLEGEVVCETFLNNSRQIDKTAEQEGGGNSMTVCPQGEGVTGLMNGPIQRISDPNPQGQPTLAQITGQRAYPLKNETEIVGCVKDGPENQNRKAEEENEASKCDVDGPGGTIGANVSPSTFNDTLTPDPHQNERNINLILKTPWKPHEPIKLNYLAPSTITSPSGFSMRTGDVIQVLEYVSSNNWHAKNLTTGIEGTIGRQDIRIERSAVDSACGATTSQNNSYASSTLTSELDVGDSETLENINRLTSTSWRYQEEVNIKIKAPMATTEGLGIARGDTIQVLRFIGGGSQIWYGKNLSTGHHGEITGLILEDFKKAIFGPSLIPDRPTLKRRRSESFSHEENLAKIFAKKWMPYEEIKPRLRLTALRTVPPGPGRLAVDKGDIITLYRCIVDSRFAARNIKTGAFGELEIDIFVAEKNREGRQGVRGSSKRGREGSLERVREFEWQSRERDLRERRENEREEKQRKLEEQKQRVFEEESRMKIDEHNTNTLEEDIQNMIDQEKKKLEERVELEESTKKIEQEERQRQRTLDIEWEKQLQKQVEEGECERQEHDNSESTSRMGNREAQVGIPISIPTGPRNHKLTPDTHLKGVLKEAQFESTSTDQLAVNILMADYKPGESVNFLAVAKTSVEIPHLPLLAVTKGDEIRLIKFVSGNMFFSENTKNGLRGQVSSDVFMDGTPAVAKCTTRKHAKWEARGEGPGGGSPTSMLGNYEVGGEEERGRGREKEGGRGRGVGRGRGEETPTIKTRNHLFHGLPKKGRGRQGRGSSTRGH